MQKQTLDSPKTRIISLCQAGFDTDVMCHIRCCSMLINTALLCAYNDCNDCSSHFWFKRVCFSLSQMLFLSAGVCWSSVGSFTLWEQTDRTSSGALHSGKGLVSTKKALACKTIPTRHPPICETRLILLKRAARNMTKHALFSLWSFATTQFVKKNLIVWFTAVKFQRTEKQSVEVKHVYLWLDCMRNLKHYKNSNKDPLWSELSLNYIFGIPVVAPPWTWHHCSLLMTSPRSVSQSQLKWCLMIPEDWHRDTLFPGIIGIAIDQIYTD